MSACIMADKNQIAVSRAAVCDRCSVSLSLNSSLFYSFAVRFFAYCFFYYFYFYTAMKKPQRIQA